MTIISLHHFFTTTMKRLGYYEIWDNHLAQRRVVRLCTTHGRHSERAVEVPTDNRCIQCERLGEFYDQFTPALPAQPPKVKRRRK